MLELLEQQTRLTTNQRKIVAAAILGDMLRFALAVLADRLP